MLCLPVCRMHQEEWNPDPESQPAASEYCKFYSEAFCQSQETGLRQQDFAIANYLSLVRTNRMGLPIIHAVGVKSWEWYDKHNGDFVYKIIWKERGTEQYVENEYPIE